MSRTSAHRWRSRLLLAATPVFTILVVPLVVVLYALFWGYDKARLGLKGTAGMAPVNLRRAIPSHRALRADWWLRALACWWVANLLGIGIAAVGALRLVQGGVALSWRGLREHRPTD